VDAAPPDRPLLSVVIPCLNDEKYLPCQLEALAAQETTFPWEVVFVDNGSTDGSVRIAHAFEGRLPLRITSAPERANQPYAQNIGAELARAEMLVFVNADDEVAPGFLESMYSALETNDFVTSPLDITSLNPAWAQHAHAVPASTHPILPDFAEGCALGIRRDVLEAVGGFREEYGPVEDRAISMRLQLMGIPVYKLPEPLLRYRYRTSVRALMRQTRLWGFYLALLHRDFGSSVLPRRPFRLVLTEWTGIVRSTIRARTKADLAQCAVRFGYGLGRLHGSCRHRVLYL
jgi:glycosyltransferase involved in cell wall biosynthesis